MPDGGLVTENERKNRLAETTARARRQPSATQKMRGWEDNLKRRTMSNIVGSSLSAYQTGRIPVLGQGLGRITEGIQQRLLQETTAGEEEEEQEGQEGQKTEQEEQKNAEQAGLQQQALGEMLGRQQQQSRLAQTKAQLLEESGLAEQKKKEAEKIRKQIKASIRQGLEEMLQGTGNAVDAGTGGVSLIVTVFMYAFTLVDLNLQMFWGYYITKKKSFFFPALEWDPIPMPKIVSVRILHAGLVVLDILVVIGIVIALSVQIIIMTAPFAALAMPVLYATDAGFRGAVNNFLFK